ncbi:MAG TPA: MarR family transcriptional regulator [Candidatus Limnocylindria bacterium]
MRRRKRAPIPELARRLNSATVHLMRALRQDGAEGGLSAEHRVALGALVFAGPMSIGDLARREQVGAPAMTKTVGILERKRLVTRTRDESDARVVRVQATAAGRAAIIKTRAERVTRIANALAGLEPDDRERIETAIVALERLILELEDTR